MNAKIVSTDSYSGSDTSSFMIDYQVDSSTAPGSPTRGTVYIRGVKTPQGFDTYRFVLEKGVDFSQLDADMMVGAIEEMIRQMPPTVQAEQKSAARFSAKNAGKNNGQNPMQSTTGEQAQEN